MNNRDNLAETFRQLNDEELQSRLACGTLTEVATEIAMEELKSRGLSLDQPLSDVSEEPADLPKRTSLETIARYSTPLQAHILKGRLEVEGIPAFVADEHLIQANWFWSNALGGVRVQVARECVLDAKAIADAMAAGDYSLQVAIGETFSLEVGDDPPPTCPRCSHNSRVPLAASRTMALAALYFLGIPLPFSRNRYRCAQCGHAWA